MMQFADSGGLMGHARDVAPVLRSLLGAAPRSAWAGGALPPAAASSPVEVMTPRRVPPLGILTQAEHSSLARFEAAALRRAPQGSSPETVRCHDGI
jgi:hypothetical protein